MERKKFKLLKIGFYVRGATQMVYCHVSFGKHDRATGFSTNLKVNGNFKNQTFFGKNSKTYNAVLDQIKADLYNAYQELRLQNAKSQITAKDVQSYYLNPDRFGLEVDFGHLAREFLETMRSQVCKSTFAHLLAKLRAVEKYGGFELSVEWLDGYKSHLQGKGFTVDHVARCVDFVCRVIRWGFEQKKVLKNPFESYSIARGDHRAIPEYLTDAELERIETGYLKSDTMGVVRDLFVFQCYTGFAYNELKNFDFAQNISDSPNGKVIRIVRQKTGEQAVLPLPKKAEKLLKKYGFKMPFIRNDHYNNYLKQLFALLGIEKRGYSHLARKTAGHRWLNMGFDYEDVAAMLGHGNPETTRKFYARVKIDRIHKTIKRLDLSW